VSDIRARGGSAHGYRVDITDDALVDAAARRVETEVGAVDVLVNNAGFVRRVFGGLFFWAVLFDELPSSTVFGHEALFVLAGAVMIV
jgi:NAD(P)-dependent dehydrogenase (short-subunit alcohol dehydrogenase family)